MTTRTAIMTTACLVTFMAGPRPAVAEERSPRRIERIAFGSCAHQDKPQPIWDDLVARRPDVFVFVGDNIYADTEDMAEMRQKYARLGAQPGYRRMRETCPILATWDDHDYGLNDGGAWYPKRAESQREFLDFFAVPADSPRRARPGIYESYRFGPAGECVQIILLDTRYFRDRPRPDGRPAEEKQRLNVLGWYAADEAPEKTILGDAQWRWLEEQLRLPADVRVIASSFQFAADEKGMESWGNFPRERRRLLDLVARTRAEGCLVISGDVHFSELSRCDDGPYPLFDFTSSGLTNSKEEWSRAVNTRRVSSGAYAKPTGGLVSIDWRGPDTTVRFEAVGVGGEVAFRHAVPLAALAMPGPPLEAEVRVHRGRPTLFVDGKPEPLVAYSPAGHWRRDTFAAEMRHFLPRRIDTFFISIGQSKVPPGGWNADFFATPLWEEDTITAAPTTPFNLSPDEQAGTILSARPDAKLCVRFFLREPASWRKLHPEELFVDETGAVHQTPSLASEPYWDAAARYAAAVVEFCESRPWAHRILGYSNFLRMEGTHEPLVQRMLYDHGPAMTARWRAHLRKTYGTVEKLREAHGDPGVTFETATVPQDPLRGPAAAVAAIPYWQPARSNRPLRDYLLLQRELFHAGFRRVAAASRAAAERLGRHRVFVYDSHKQSMLGWDNIGFFDPKSHWPHTWPDEMTGSGLSGIAGLFDVPGCDGLITPHDYQARGLGGVFEPEGSADTAVLRGKLMLCEMDTRTWAGTDPIAPARDAREFAVLTWRNVATALTRGFTPYWMDVFQDWFAPDELQPIIDRQADVLRESIDWPHETVPGIAMILDDEAVLETNGDGRFLNEAVMWEWKTGLARCGVPLRIHLLDDLARADFPDHRVLYFPNLFRIDPARRKLLEEKALRGGRVVVWGPGSGISDGTTIGAASAAGLTGFAFEMLEASMPRRTLLSNVAHPLTRGLSPATVLGGPLAYGPVLLPTDGTPLGVAWAKQGRNLAGLAVKECTAADGSKWTSIFTSTPGLPAAFWRNAARMAGAHVWCEDDEVVLADGGMVAIHSLAGGPRRLRLPRACDVVDLITGRPLAAGVREIGLTLESPDTRVFRLLPPADR